MSGGADLGIVGLGTMGSNLALNAVDHGFGVAALDLDDERVRRFVGAHPDQPLTAAVDAATLVAALARPRRILLMVPAGEPVDGAIADLAPRLDPGDVLIDGGNSHFEDTERRAAALADRGLAYVGMGVSGGAEGARHGPSLMPGGPARAYAALAPILEAIAAGSDAGPCVAHLGPGGAGHFVKMVHNGIEYADMQAIAEAYHLLSTVGFDADDLSRTFAVWNEGPLESYLIEITAGIFRVRDDDGAPLVERILDEAEQKGTGRWTAVEALRAAVPAPSISAAVDARVLSSRREERLRASRALEGPGLSPPAVDDREALAADVGDALLAARIAAFVQGFDLIRRVSDERGWEVPRAEVARVWRAGCIIRCRLLDPIREALLVDPAPESLLLDPGIAGTIVPLQPGWRRAIAAARSRGIPAPAWSAALDWFDASRAERLPQNLVQAQRDWFGAHRYRRLDDPAAEPVHTDWAAEAASPT